MPKKKFIFSKVACFKNELFTLTFFKGFAKSLINLVHDF